QQRQLMTVPEIVVVTACMAASVTDVRSFRIPNYLTLPLLATGLLYHASSGMAPLISAAFGALFGGFILLLPFCLGGMGAGDVKLLAGVGAWLGLPDTVYVFIGAALCGGVYALALFLLSALFPSPGGPPTTGGPFAVSPRPSVEEEVGK